MDTLAEKRRKPRPALHGSGARPAEGLGDSADPPKPYTAESLAAIIATGIDKVAPNDRVAIAGFSFGSVLGGHVAAQMGQRVSSLLLLGAAGLGLPRKPLELTRVEPGMTPAQIAAVQRGNLVKLMFGDESRVDGSRFICRTKTRAARVATAARSLSPTR